MYIIKYTDYLEQTLESIKESQASEGHLSYVNIVKCLPILEGDVSKKYPTNELLFIESILEKLDSLDPFQHLHINNSSIPTKHHRRYRVLQNLKQNDLPRTKTALFWQEYGNNLGNTYFICKAIDSESNATERNEVIQSIKSKLPKYFSRGYKRKAKEMMSLIISEKITPGQFCSMWRELAGG